MSGLKHYLESLEEAHPLTHDLDPEPCSQCGDEDCDCVEGLNEEMNEENK